MFNCDGNREDVALYFVLRFFAGMQVYVLTGSPLPAIAALNLSTVHVVRSAGNTSSTDDSANKLERYKRYGLCGRKARPRGAEGGAGGVHCARDQPTGPTRDQVHPRDVPPPLFSSRHEGR